MAEVQAEAQPVYNRQAQLAEARLVRVHKRQRWPMVGEYRLHPGVRMHWLLRAAQAGLSYSEMLAVGISHPVLSRYARILREAGYLEKASSSIGGECRGDGFHLTDKGEAMLYLLNSGEPMPREEWE